MIRRILSTAALVALISVPTAAAGQSDADGKRPQLGEHRFIVNTLTRDPFPRTYLRQQLGVGKVLDVDILPEIEIAGDTIGGQKGNLLFANLEIEYMQRLDDWVSVWGQVNVNARLGDDLGALLGQGVTVVNGFELGWLFRVLSREKVQLAATANLWNGSFTGIDLVGFVEDIVNDSVTPRLVRKTPTLRGGGGLRLAWAANRWLGINATGEVGYGEAIDRRDEDKTFVHLAGGASVDLMPLINTPIGFALAADWDTYPRQGGDLSQNLTRIELRLAYTGREDFLVSLDLGWARLPLQGAGTSNAASIRAGMQYWF